LLLLSGLGPDEALKLRWSDVDLDSGAIHAGGESGREIAIDGALRQLLHDAPRAPGSELLLSSMRRPATPDRIDAQILCAAHDAALEDATQVTSACLRHTYVAFLVRQGIRFADLTRLVGPLPAEVVGAYSALSPAGARVRAAQIQRLHPALREESA
jgi:integrase